MGKWYGAIGFIEAIQKAPGVYIEDITKHYYYGDVIRNVRRLESSGEVNDSVNIQNDISIVADPYADQNFHNIRYAEFMGTKWKVTNISVQYPRLILTLGGEYNGK